MLSITMRCAAVDDLHGRTQHFTPFATQTLVNIGGAAGYMAGYNATYWTLFGQPLELAPDGSSLVTHMLVLILGTKNRLRLNSRRKFQGAVRAVAGGGARRQLARHPNAGASDDVIGDSQPVHVYLTFLSKV